MSELTNNHYLRCSYCNSVCAEEIASETGSYIPGLIILPDPRDDTKMICEQCTDIVMETNSEFSMYLDEGWSDIEADEGIEE